MHEHATSLRGRYRGFTLIELMVVVVIATILLGIAVPSYMSQIRKSRRTDAKTALLELAGREERFLSTNGSVYSSLAADMGYTGWGAANPVGSGYYQIQAPVVCNTGPCAGGLPAALLYSSRRCRSPGRARRRTRPARRFTVDSTGRQTAADGGGVDQTAVCWQQ